MQIELVQRSDKKWVVYGYMPDPQENPNDWRGRELLLPMRWVPVSVVDHVGEFVNGQALIYSDL